MGFSVSGATVIVFLGIVISFGMAYTAANNGVELINDAYEDSTDDELTRQNTDVRIASASAADQGDKWHLNVTVENTGSTSLSIADTDILIDGNYTPHTNDNMVVEVADTTETSLWLPGERLRVNATPTAQPSRVKIVTGSGVSATTDVNVTEVN